MTWEQRMARNAKLRHREELRRRGLLFGPMPTEPPRCCCVWELDPYHGWGQQQICGYFGDPEYSCDHEHHKHEIWYAGLLRGYQCGMEAGRL